MKWRWIALVCVLLVGGGVGGILRFGPGHPQTGSASSEKQLVIPHHRERSIFLVGDEPVPEDVDPRRIVRMSHGKPSPPDAETRRGFDGRWQGDTDAGPVTVFLLDGIGDLHTGSGDQAKVWGFEIQQYFGADLIDLQIWREDCGAWWVAEYHEETDSILVRAVNGEWNDRPLEGILKLPEVPFRLRREKPDSR